MFFLSLFNCFGSRFNFLSGRTFPHGLPVKIEGEANRSGSTEAVAIRITSADRSDENNDAAPPAPGPDEENYAVPLNPPAPGPRRHRILSSTMLFESSACDISLFDNISLMSSSGVPTISSGTMRVLGPIIELALIEEEEHVVRENSMAVVPYISHNQWLAGIINAREQRQGADANPLAVMPYIPLRQWLFGIIGSTRGEMKTRLPIVRLDPPSAPKKDAAVTSMEDVDRAMRRLMIFETNDPNESLASPYENIDSPEYFFDD